MKIVKVEISCFRALHTVSVSLNQFSVLIGENDVGKTSFLHAIDKFFAAKKLEDATDWFKGKTDDAIEIVLTFQSLPNDDQLAPLRRQDGSLVISRTFSCGQTPVTKAIRDDNFRTEVTKAIQSKYLSSENFHLIPVRRDLAVQFSMTKTALLGKTLRARMRQILDAGNGAGALDELTETMRQALEEPKSILQKYLRQQMHNDAVSLEFDELQIDPIEGLNFIPKLSDDRVESVLLQNRGAGTQNNLILALFRLIADLKLDVPFIFAMEEPENSLHPKAQRQLLSVLQEISTKNQVIVTTHSPVFIDRSSFESNILLTRTKEGNTVTKTFNVKEMSQIRKDLGIRASDALLKGGGNCAILVEGNTEEDGFPVFLEMMGFSEFQLGIAIINLGGSDFEKVSGTARLLKAYDVPCVVVLDSDAKGCADDVVRARDKGDLTNVCDVFCLSRGTIEDYYPLEIVAKIINDYLSPDKPVDVMEFDSKKNGEARLSDFRRIMHEHNAGSSIEYLKTLLGGHGTRMLQFQGAKVDAELVDIFEAVVKIADR